MHRIGILSVAGAAVAAAVMLMAPLTASAATTPHVATFATCSTDEVGANFGADVYTGPDSFAVRDTVTAGFAYPCTGGVFIGRRYTACGESDGNGWIEVTSANHGAFGWSPQACFVDVVPLGNAQQAGTGGRMR
jgi:hypothetical protein